MKLVILVTIALSAVTLSAAAVTPGRRNVCNVLSGAGLTNLEVLGCSHPLPRSDDARLRPGADKITTCKALAAAGLQHLDNLGCPINTQRGDEVKARTLGPWVPPGQPAICPRCPPIPPPDASKKAGASALEGRHEPHGPPSRLVQCPACPHSKAEDTPKDLVRRLEAMPPLPLPSPHPPCLGCAVEDAAHPPPTTRSSPPKMTSDPAESKCAGGGGGNGGGNDNGPTCSLKEMCSVFQSGLINIDILGCSRVSIGRGGWYGDAARVDARAEDGGQEKTEDAAMLPRCIDNGGGGSSNHVTECKQQACKILQKGGLLNLDILGCSRIDLL